LITCYNMFLELRKGTVI